MSMSDQAVPRISVCFLARGAEDDWQTSVQRFLISYQSLRAGLPHQLYVVFKGYSDQAGLAEAQRLFAATKHVAISLDDRSLDIGAYIEAAKQMTGELVCFFNTHSEILGKDWLLKLTRNLLNDSVGLVGATGSFESLSGTIKAISRFPNIHIRSNAFLVRKEHFLAAAQGVKISGKADGYLFESGPASLTRFVRGLGLGVRVVGRNGRGYPPPWWPHSDTFRSRGQGNLLVGDNQTRRFRLMPWPEKAQNVRNTWGPYLEETALLNEAYQRQLL